MTRTARFAHGGWSIALILFGCSANAPDAAQSDAAVAPSPDAARSDAAVAPSPDALCGLRPSGSLNGSHVLRFESQAQPIVVQLERRYVEAGAGESAIYALDGFGLHSEGRTLCSDAATPLDYVNSHHNWQDAATATFGKTRYELDLSYSFDDGARWAFTLSRAESGASEVVADDLILTGAPVWCFECPGRFELVVSEVMANNQQTLSDDRGEYEPWIEVFNPSSSDVDLTGWSLSNDLSNRRLFTFAEGVLPRHETLVVFADAQPEQGPLHAPFSLSPQGGAFVLTAPDGQTDGGRLYTEQQPDTSLVPDLGTGQYVLSAAPSPGQWISDSE